MPERFYEIDSSIVSNNDQLVSKLNTDSSKQDCYSDFYSSGYDPGSNYKKVNKGQGIII